MRRPAFTIYLLSPASTSGKEGRVPIEKHIADVSVRSLKPFRETAVARSTSDHNLWLSELEAPFLDLSGGEAAQTLLDRLKTQNSALDRLRHELVTEEGFIAPGSCAVQSL
jgi:hypothetical protein